MKFKAITKSFSHAPSLKVVLYEGEKNLSQNRGASLVAALVPQQMHFPGLIFP